MLSVLCFAGPMQANMHPLIPASLRPFPGPTHASRNRSIRTHVCRPTVHTHLFSSASPAFWLEGASGQMWILPDRADVILSAHFRDRLLTPVVDPVPRTRWTTPPTVAPPTRTPPLTSLP